MVEFGYNVNLDFRLTSELFLTELTTSRLLEKKKSVVLEFALSFVIHEKLN